MEANNKRPLDVEDSQQNKRLCVQGNHSRKDSKEPTGDIDSEGFRFFRLRSGFDYTSTDKSKLLVMLDNSFELPKEHLTLVTDPSWPAFSMNRNWTTFTEVITTLGEDKRSIHCVFIQTDSGHEKFEIKKGDWVASIRFFKNVDASFTISPFVAEDWEEEDKEEGSE